ncbi:MAG TPA: chromate efflux transporter [Tepidisphaeraceae bacterium]|jgi:chromate transporter
MPPPETSPQSPHRVAEVARLFLRLGFTAFGGPAAHVALIEEEVVHRRNWLDRQHFLDIVSAVNFIPGPNSTELAIHVGYLRAGWRGLVAAGVCFIVPAMLIILPIAWAYVAFGAKPGVGHALVGIKACMVAIVVVAMGRFAKTGVRDPFTTAIALLSLASAVLLQHYHIPQPELIILAAAALAGLIRAAARPAPAAATPSPHPLTPSSPHPDLRRTSFFVLPLSLAPATFTVQLTTMALFFLKVGATLFGSGYVLASFLHSGLVEQHRWLTEQELLDAIAVGQVTPGPLLTAATFIGYLLSARNFGGGTGGGILGGVVATTAIFLPSFCFVAILGPVLPRLRANRLARGALDGMNAAVVSLILVVSIWFARSVMWNPAGHVERLGVAVFALALLILIVTKLNPTWLIAASALIGLIVYGL